MWKQLLDKERLAGYLDDISNSYDSRFDRIKTIDEPIVYVDSSDAFVESILAARKNGQFDDQISEKVHRYFKYLSYLPLVVNDMASCLIFLEVIDSLEMEIAACLKVARPLPLFKRMKPDSKLFLQYFHRFGLDYTER